MLGAHQGKFPAADDTATPPQPSKPMLGTHQAGPRPTDDTAWPGRPSQVSPQRPAGQARRARIKAAGGSPARRTLSLVRCA